jgi:tetratricopeptide (TPR) repeat protein
LAANKRKILEAARKHAQKGAKDKALKEYEKLIKLDPKDAKLRLEVGDAHRRWGQIDAAITAYSKVAHQYMTEGFDARAVAVFKQIQNLDPERFDSYEPLAELYQRMGLTTEAINALQTAADGYHRAGKRREALELLRKMATVDPTNTTSRIKVADLLRQEGLNDESVAEYEAVAEELDRHDDAEALESLLERILEVEPERASALVRLTRSLVGRGQGARAEPFAKRAVAAEPDSPENYELLAEIYRITRREDALAGVYQKLADLYDQRGEPDRARDIRQRFGAYEGLSTEDPQFGEVGDESLLGDDSLGPEADPLLEKSTLVGDSDSGLLQNSGLSSEASIQGDLSELLDDDLLDGAAGSEPEPEPEPVPVETLVAPPRPAEFDPEQMLAEASVYLRYGKSKQAIENLEAILAREPSHRAALEKLGEAFADAEEPERAVQAWLRAAEQARGDGDERAVSVLRGRIAALDESAAAGLDPGEAEAAPPEVALEEPASPEPADEGPESFAIAGAPAEAESGAGDDGGDIDLDIDGEDGLDLDVDVSELDAEAAADQTPVAAEEESPEPAAKLGVSALAEQVDEHLEEANFYKQQGLLDEAEVIYRRLLEVAPNHPQVLVQLGEIAAARGEDPASTASGPAAPQAVGEFAADAGESLADLAEELPVPEAAAAEPADELDDTPLAVEAPDSIDLDLDPDDTGTITSDDVEVPAGSADFDLAAELTGALDRDPNDSTFTGSAPDDGFEAVFSAFKKGVRQTLSEGDHQSHYDLGIAYREMGLLDDAMSEFRTSMQSPRLRIDSLHMLGLCALDRNEAQDAVSHFEQALALPDVSDEQKLASRFDLGRALEAAGDAARAREAWEAVAAVDPGFCGVRERLARLGAPRAAGAPSDTATGDYESFDDLIEEANAPNGGLPGAGPAAEEGKDDSERPPAAPRSRGRKKKKISFL